MGCFATTAVSVEKTVLGSKLKIVHLKDYGGVPEMVILLAFLYRGNGGEAKKMRNYFPMQLTDLCRFAGQTATMQPQ